MDVRRLPNALGSLALSTPERDAALLRATTDLFVHRAPHDRDEITRFEELATHFLPKVGVADRIHVAEALAGCADAPRALLRQLGKDLAEVAAPILTRSTGLSTIDLLAVIAGSGPLHHRLIAARRTLPPEVIKALRLTGDTDVAALLDANAEAREPEVVPGLQDFGGPGVDDPGADEVTVPFPAYLGAGRPQPLPAGAAAEEFLTLGREGRLRVLAELTARRAAAPEHPLRRTLDSALQSAYRGPQIIAFARRRQKEELIAAFADGLRLDVELVRRAVDDVSGEPLVVLLKAIGLADADARLVLLLANPSIGLVVDSFFRLADLHAGLETGVAEVLVSAWRAERRPVAPRHLPQLADAPGRRQAAAETRRTVPEQRQTGATAAKRGA